MVTRTKENKTGGSVGGKERGCFYLHKVLDLFTFYLNSGSPTKVTVEVKVLKEVRVRRGVRKVSV